MADKGLEKWDNKRVRQKKKKTNHMRNDEILNLHYGGGKKVDILFPLFQNDEF